MPRPCVVPGCKSNYTKQSESISTFSFPTNEDQREQWVRAIHRDFFQPTKYSAVCIKHFAEKFIIRETSTTLPDGRVLTEKRARPILTPDAVPTVFENQPSYMTLHLPSRKTKTPEERQRENELRQRRELEEWLEKDKIKSFDFFVEQFPQKLVTSFLVKVCESHVWFYSISFDGSSPQISMSLKITADFRVQYFINGKEVSAKYFEFIFGPDMLCNRWSMFQTLMKHLSSSTVMPLTVSTTDKIKEAITLLESSIDDLQSNDDNISRINKLKFLKEQIHRCILPPNAQYSTETFILACSIFLPFPGAYRLLRDAEALTLPHPVYIKRLTAGVKSEAGLTNNQITYLKRRCNQLEDYEKTVNLLFDEINIQAKFQYSGGRLQGAALTQGKVEAATKVQAFMMTSLFSKYEDVAALFPVKNASSELLYDWTLKVIKILTEIGYAVLSLICDNHKMNYSMYESLCKTYSGNMIEYETIVEQLEENNENEKAPKKKKKKPEPKMILAGWFYNPFKQSEKIFLLFDSVHLFKSIRNNWLNQKDPDQTFIYPSFNDSSLVLRAKVKDIKTLYFSESHKIVKVAPHLTQKVLFPSNFERQNVLLACRLFEEKTQEALQSHFSSDDPCNGAAEFARIIYSWWKIFNVRSPRSGYNLRDPLRAPIRDIKDENINFLHEFIAWLDAWRKVQVKKDPKNPKHKGKLTDVTFRSLIHTVKTILQIIEYVFEKFKPKYILLGKFQTDRIEGNFGRYRRMSGTIKSISVKEILDSEKRIKVMKLLRMKSAKGGTFLLKHFSDEDEKAAEGAIQLEVLVDLSPALEECDSLDVNLAEKKALFFIGGYIGHALVKYLNNCSDCKTLVVLDDNFSADHLDRAEVSSYVLNLSRGGLKQPTDFLVEITTVMYKLFCTLINEKFEKNFITCKDQRATLKELGLLKVDELCDDALLENNCSSCGKSTSDLISRALRILSNIFNNNYCKMMNDLNRECHTTAATTKSKLSTLTKKKATKRQASTPLSNEATDDTTATTSKLPKPTE